MTGSGAHFNWGTCSSNLGDYLPEVELWKMALPAIAGSELGNHHFFHVKLGERKKKNGYQHPGRVPRMS